MNTPTPKKLAAVDDNINADIDALFGDLKKARAEQKKLPSQDGVEFEVLTDRISGIHRQLLSIFQKLLQDTKLSPETMAPSSGSSRPPSRSMEAIDDDIEKVYRHLKKANGDQKKKSATKSSGYNADSQALGAHIGFMHRKLHHLLGERLQDSGRSATAFGSDSIASPQASLTGLSLSSSDKKGVTDNTTPSDSTPAESTPSLAEAKPSRTPSGKADDPITLDDSPPQAETSVPVQSSTSPSIARATSIVGTMPLQSRQTRPSSQASSGGHAFQDDSPTSTESADGYGSPDAFILARRAEREANDAVTVSSTATTPPAGNVQANANSHSSAPFSAIITATTPVPLSRQGRLLQPMAGSGYPLYSNSPFLGSSQYLSPHNIPARRTYVGTTCPFRRNDSPNSVNALSGSPPRRERNTPRRR